VFRCNKFTNIKSKQTSLFTKISHQRIEAETAQAKKNFEKKLQRNIFERTASTLPAYPTLLIEQLQISSLPQD